MRILMINDNRDEALAIKQRLKSEKCLTDLAYTTQAGLQLAKSNIYNAIILSDALDKGLDGHTLKTLRGIGVTTPVLIIGQNMSLEKMQRCFHNGADDFINRPLEMALLILRLRVMVKRQGSTATYYRLGDVEFIPSMHLIKGVNGEVPLTGKEAEMLELLVINRQQILPKVVIEEHLWPNKDDFSDNNIEVHMSNLRKKLRQMTELLSIETIRNGGYCFRVKEDSLFMGNVY